MSNPSPPVFVPPPAPAEEEIMQYWPVSDQVTLSVVCITFNHAEFIELALNGILMQKTDFRFEVFVRDDASNDGTSEIVKRYAERYPSIIKPIIEPENTYSKGISPWMVIFPKTAGKYIAHCEGDDYWGDPQKLQKQIDYLEAHPECVITFHDAVVVDENNKLVRQSVLEDQKRSYSKQDLVDTGNLPNLTRCYRNLIRDLPAEFAKTQSGDTFICSMLGEFGTGVALSNIDPSYYRVHSGGTWQGINNNQRKIDVASTFYWIALHHRNRGNKLTASRLLMFSMMTLSSNPKLKLSWLDRIKTAGKILIGK